MNQDHREAGRQLMKIRGAYGLTQKQLADKSGLTERTISSFENGDVWPRAATLAKLEAALGLDEGYFTDLHLKRESATSEMRTTADKIQEESRRFAESRRIQEVPAELLDQLWKYTQEAIDLSALAVRVGGQVEISQELQMAITRLILDIERTLRTRAPREVQADLISARMEVDKFWFSQNEITEPKREWAREQAVATYLLQDKKEEGDGVEEATSLTQAAGSAATEEVPTPAQMDDYRRRQEEADNANIDEILERHAAHEPGGETEKQRLDREAAERDTYSQDPDDQH